MTAEQKYDLYWFRGEQTELIKANADFKLLQYIKDQRKQMVQYKTGVFRIIKVNQYPFNKR